MVMMKYFYVKLLVCVTFCLCMSGAYAQSLTIEMDKDTISLEETVQLQYRVDKSCNGNDLKFDNFLVVSGPSISRSISIVNGKRTAESSFSVIITPIEEGVYELPQELCGARLDQPVKIVVIAGYESNEVKERRIRSKRKIKKI